MRTRNARYRLLTVAWIPVREPKREPASSRSGVLLALQDRVHGSSSSLDDGSELVPVDGLGDDCRPVAHQVGDLFDRDVVVAHPIEMCLRDWRVTGATRPGPPGTSGQGSVPGQSPISASSRAARKAPARGRQVKMYASGGRRAGRRFGPPVSGPGPTRWLASPSGRW